MRAKARLLANNKKASFNYDLEGFLECGLALKGTEIKSLRVNGATLKDAYVLFKDGEAFVLNMNIAPYKQGNVFNHEPERPRKLLMHKREVLRYAQKAKEQALTVVPTRVYLKNGRAKIEIALARGKKRYDKRAAIRKREDERLMDKARKSAGKEAE